MCHFQRQIQIINHLQSQFKSMLRSSSVSQFAGLKIAFNPQEAKVGHSSIDRLPIRRAHSQKSITQVSQVSQALQAGTLQNQQYTINMLKRMNESLERENQFLKKQLDYFTKVCSSKRNSITGVPAASGKKRQQTEIRDRLLSRLEVKAEKDKNDTESTGLYNSKISNSGRRGDNIEDAIADLWTKVEAKKVLPKVEVFREVTNSFLDMIKENYFKLKVVAGEIGKKGSVMDRIPKDTTDILNFLECVVLVNKNPKIAKNLAKQLEMPKHKNSRVQLTKQQKIQQIVNEFCTMGDFMSLLESLSKVAIKNSKIVGQLKNNVTFSRLLAKISRSE